MAITLDQVRDSLITVDEAMKLVEPLETMGESEFEMGQGQISFQLPDGWNDELGDLEGTGLTKAKVSIDGKEFGLTKDAVLGAGSLIGITREYLARTPGHLMEPHLNFWYGTDASNLNYSAHKGGSKNLKLIWNSDDVGLAFCRSSLTSFSTQRVLENIIDAMRVKYGEDAEILVDKRLQVGIRNTTMRLLVPETERSMKSKLANEEGNDPWSAGVAYSCSLTGDTPLQVAGFMLRYVCTNGATTEHSSSAKHRRRRGEEVEEVYQWVAEEVDQILESLEGELASVDDLTKISLGDDIPNTLHELYSQFGVPVSAREAITEQMMSSDDTTAYGLMQAITQSANDDSLSPAEVQRLWMVGGSIPHVLAGRCPQCHRLPK